METRRIHDQLISFAVSTMLTSAMLVAAPHGTINAAAGPQPQAVVSALSGLRAGGWAGLKDVSVPDAVSVPMTAPAADTIIIETPPAITSEQFQKLASLTASYGHDIPLDKRATDPLGLTSGSENITVRELSMLHKAENTSNAMGALPAGGYIFFFASGETTWIYVTNQDLKLVTSLRTKINPISVFTIPIDEAQAGLKVQLAYWAHVADTH